jgi:hypothetical protein
MPATKYCLRIRPYNVKKRAITRRYTYRGRRFSHEDPWVVTEDRELAKELSQITDRHGNPVFEVKTLSAAQEDRRRRENDPTMGDEIGHDAFRSPKRDKAAQLGEFEKLHPATRIFEGGDEYDEEDYGDAPRDEYEGMGDVDFSEPKEDIFREEEEEKLDLAKPKTSARKAPARRKTTGAKKTSSRKRRSSGA